MEKLTIFNDVYIENGKVEAHFQLIILIEQNVLKISIRKFGKIESPPRITKFYRRRSVSCEEKHLRRHKTANLKTNYRSVNRASLINYYNRHSCHVTRETCHRVKLGFLRKPIRGFVIRSVWQWTLNLDTKNCCDGQLRYEERWEIKSINFFLVFVVNQWSPSNQVRK